MRYLFRSPSDSDVIEDLPRNVVVVRSKRARRMALRVDTKNRVVNLVLPPRQNIVTAVRFADQHRDWIRAQIASLPKNTPFRHGEEIPVMGKQTMIWVEYNPDRKTTHISLKGRRLIVKTNRRAPGQRIERWLKTYAKEQLSALAHEKATFVGRKVKSIRIGDTRSRWGSCSHEGKLAFSWRLIFAPYETFDYVVAHEVAHLRHMDHSQKFWRLCEELSYDYEYGKEWIREHGKTLMRFGG